MDHMEGMDSSKCSLNITVDSIQMTHWGALQKGFERIYAIHRASQHCQVPESIKTQRQ